MVFPILLAMCMGISWMEQSPLLCRAWRVWHLCKFHLNITWHLFQHTCNCILFCSTVLCFLEPFWCTRIYMPAHLDYCHAWPIFLQFKLQLFTLLFTWFYYTWWPSSGIFLRTIFKAPFQLNCHGLVIWIHCKYGLFKISPYAFIPDFILTDDFLPGIFQTII